ncbi:MAG: hypothetical protein ACO1QB_01270 [Verrucomicrobiales bacterium]
MRESNRNNWQFKFGQQNPSPEAQLVRDFASLCEADCDDFTAMLEAVKQSAIYASIAHLPGKEPINNLLLACFKVTAESEVYFHGTPKVAHQAMCLAALLYNIGWDKLSTPAQVWASQMRNCNVPSTLGSTGPLDIDKARTLMEQFTQKDLAHAAKLGSRQKAQQVIDPFIGM